MPATDVVDATTRSRMMRGIRSKNTQPEMIVRRGLHAAGLRFRIHDRRLSGTPDVVLPKYRAAVSVRGCFWHGHDCSYFRLPKTRSEFWRNKIESNRQRDAKNERELLVSGWRHATVWECALRQRPKSDVDTVLGTLVSWVRSDQPTISIRGNR